MPILEHFDGPDAPVHIIAWIDDESTERLIADASEGTRFIFQATFDDADEAKAWLDQRRAWSPRSN